MGLLETSFGNGHKKSKNRPSWASEGGDKKKKKRVIKNNYCAWCVWINDNWEMEVWFFIFLYERLPSFSKLVNLTCYDFKIWITTMKAKTERLKKKSHLWHCLPSLTRWLFWSKLLALKINNQGILAGNNFWSTNFFRLQQIFVPKKTFLWNWVLK